MNTLIKVVFVGFMLCIFQSAKAESRNALVDESKPFYINRTIWVMDTIATKELINEKIRLASEEINSLKLKMHSKENKIASISSQIDSTNHKIKVLSSRRDAYNNILSKINKFSQYSNYLNGKAIKIKDKDEINTLMGIFDLINISEKPKDYNAYSADTLIYLSPSFLNELRNFKPKEYDINQVKKDIKKGKINLITMIYLSAINSSINDNILQINQSISSENNNIRNLESQINELADESEKLDKNINYLSTKNSFASYFSELVDYNNYPTKKIIVQEEIKRPYGVDNTENDKLVQSAGWEWVNEDLEEKTEHFPYNVTYLYSPNHPDYRIKLDHDNSIKGAAYSADGQLIRVLSFNGQKELHDLRKDFIREMVIKDYKNNKYDILKKPKSVAYAIENRLGLSNAASKKDAASRDKFVDDYKKLSKNYNPKSKAAQKKAGMWLFGALMDQSMREAEINNPDAINFIKQCEEDHKNDFGSLWKIDRIDNTSFMVFIYNEALDKIRKYKFTFYSEDAFGKVKSRWEKVSD